MLLQIIIIIIIYLRLEIIVLKKYINKVDLKKQTFYIVKKKKKTRKNKIIYYQLSIFSPSLKTEKKNNEMIKNGNHIKKKSTHTHTY